MTAYIIKSSVSLLLMYGLYWFILRKEKLFVFNRFFLVASVVFSLILPFISIPVNFQVTPQLNDIIPAYVPEINNPENIVPGDVNFTQPYVENEASVINISAILFMLYISGVILLLIRFLRNIYIISRRCKSAEKISYKGYQIVLTNDNAGPYCFFSNIFLNKDDYKNGKIDKELLDHELEHAMQSHSFDIILIELVKIFYWFNPVHVLYERAIRINHEYLADNGVINDNSDIKSYADKLLGFITGRSNMSLTSGSENSFTKLRLLMMMKPGSRRFSYGARIVVTICIGTVISLFLCFKESDKQLLQSNLSGMEAELNQIIVNFRNPDLTTASALVVINGVILDYKETLKVNPGEIESYKILKDNEATGKYGDKGKDGVLEIVLYGYKPGSTGNKRANGAASDTSKHITLLSVNHISNKGELIVIPVSNLQSASIWTYNDNSAKNKKELRTIGIMTRDYYTVRGKVVGENGKPLSGVKISASDNPATITSDKEGHFIIEDVKENGLLEFSLPGYKPYYLSTLYEVAFNEQLTIELREDNINEKDDVSFTDDKIFLKTSESELLKFLGMNTKYPQEAKASSDTGRVFVVVKLQKGGIVKECKAFTDKEGINVPFLPEVVIVGYKSFIEPGELRPGKTTGKTTGNGLIALQTECVRVANKLSVNEIPDWKDKNLEFAVTFIFALK